ncbi:MAG: NADH-quinone oxidoreductase subunit C [Myxococcales bacterium]|nr:NADH-quinone oxidoreductase subunit C [Myxococcales bacterium]
MSVEALARAKHLLGAAVTSTHSYRGDDTLVVDPARIADVMKTLRDDPELAMAFLVDLTAVDYFGREPRFEVVYHLKSFKTGARLRVKAPLAEPEDGGNPAIDTVVPLWATANWMERETWDLYGIQFRGHPDLRRILMYEEFVGHPLRKDYPKEKRQPLVRRPPDEV